MTRDLRRDRLQPHETGVCSIAAAIIGTVGTVVGASISAGGASKAADTQKHMYDTTRGDLLPFTQFGQNQLGGMNKLLSGDPKEVQAQLEQLPGYQFALTQGLKSVQNSATARGLGVSGAAMKGAATYATGLADQTFGEQFNRLYSAASLGENAAAQTGTVGAQTAANQGAAQQAAGNALGNGFSQAGNYFALAQAQGAQNFNQGWGAT